MYLMQATMAAILFLHRYMVVFEGTPSNINKYIIKHLSTKNGAFIRFVTKILLSHLTTRSALVLKKGVLYGWRSI